jgi:ATP synthase subunit 6
MLFSPLEQFEIIPLLGFGTLSITNSSLFMILAVFFLVVFFYLAFLPAHNGMIVPNAWQQVAESIYSFVSGMVNETLSDRGAAFLPFVFTLFTFILSCNLLGLIPYSFTVTSHIVVTFALTMAIWVGKLIIGIRIHGIKLLGMFLPGGTPFILVPFLIILEIIAFTMTLISLSVRLFANLMAGHILLKVFAGFAWTMMMVGGGLWFLHFLPLLILFCLLGLETGVAMVQAYVFSLLTCMYFNDMIEGGH